MTASLPDRVWRRLSVPCTPTELAAIMRRPVKVIRATLFTLKKQGRAHQLDRCIKRNPGPGRAEYLWERRRKRLTLAMKLGYATDALLRIASAAAHVGRPSPDEKTCDRYTACALCIAKDAIWSRAIRDTGGRRAWTTRAGT